VNTRSNAEDGIPHLLGLFAFHHLPHLEERETASRFSTFAHDLASTHPDGPELRIALRRLKEAKDAAVQHVTLTGRTGREDDSTTPANANSLAAEVHGVVDRVTALAETLLAALDHRSR
jgi:hypothetical protein